MKSAITVSLVPEAINGPFLFHGDVPEACRVAKSLGFDGIELFAPGPETLPAKELKTILDDHGLALAAVGTGAGWLQQKLTLTSPDVTVRQKAIDFIASMIDYGAAFDAPAIIGSMQGRWGTEMPFTTAHSILADSLTKLAVHAERMPLLIEPLNRYESNLWNRLVDGVELLDYIEMSNVKLLADLFHMNVEEADMAAAILSAGPFDGHVTGNRIAGGYIGHVHIADSNRGPAGGGHTNFSSIGDALKSAGYGGYISAEAFPRPDAVTAATMTMAAFNQHFCHSTP